MAYHGAIARVACGWAEQYSDDGKPAWAREFEPPATSMTAVEYAAEALLMMYDLTGDDQYRASLRKCLEWGLNMPEAYKGYLLYDPETGEPVTARGYNVYRESHPAFQGASPYRTSLTYFTRLQERIHARVNGPLIPSREGVVPRRAFEQRPVSVDTVAAELDAAKAAAQTPVATLQTFRRGEFPAGGILNEHPRHGRFFWPGHGAPDVQRVLNYIHAAKVAVGEMALWTVPTYDDGYFGVIDPPRDWYKTPLLQAAPAEQNSGNE